MRSLSRKALSIVMSIVLVVGLAPLPAFAGDGALQAGAMQLGAQDEDDGPVTASGTWGQLSWNLDEEGCLTITGEGPMDDFSTDEEGWKVYKERVKSVIIESGITAVGAGAFSDFYNMTTIQLPKTITEIGANAFGYCGLQSITLPASLVRLGSSDEEAYAQDASAGLNCCEYLKEITVDAGCEPYHSDAYGVLYRGDELIAYPSGATRERYEVEEGTKAIASCSMRNAYLKVLGLPESFRTLDDQIYLWLTALERYEVSSDNAVFFSDDEGVLYERLSDGVHLVSYPSGKEKLSYAVCDGTNAIDGNAFECCSIDALAICASVKSIECRGSVGSFLVDETNPNYFSDGSGVLYQYEQTDNGTTWKRQTLVRFPTGSDIEHYAVLPGTVYINSHCFEPGQSRTLEDPPSEPALVSVTIPSSVSDVGYGAFYNSRVSNVTVLGSETVFADNQKWGDDSEVSLSFRVRPESRAQEWASDLGYPAKVMTAPDFEVSGLEDSYEFTGDAIRPADASDDFKVSTGSVELGRDNYRTYYCDNVTGPTATLLVDGAGDYTGLAAEVTFNITGAPEPPEQPDVYDLSRGSVSGLHDLALAWVDGSADGNRRFTVYDAEGWLVPEYCYSVAYRAIGTEELSENVPSQLGDYEIIIDGNGSAGSGSYYGTLTGRFKIVDRTPLDYGMRIGMPHNIQVRFDNVEDAFRGHDYLDIGPGRVLNGGYNTIPYKGDDYLPHMSVSVTLPGTSDTDEQTKLLEGRDFKVTFFTGGTNGNDDLDYGTSWEETDEIVDKGFYFARVEGVGDYIGAYSCGFYVLDPNDIRGALVVHAQSAQSANPNVQEIEVWMGNGKLREGEDYIVEYYFDNIASESDDYDFSIGSIDRPSTENQGLICVQHKLVDGEYVETPLGARVSVDRSGNYGYIVRGIGDYLPTFAWDEWGSVDQYGLLSARFSGRDSGDISRVEVFGLTDKEYIGVEQVQDVVLTLGGETLVEGVDYNLTYVGNIEVGTALMTIVGIGDFAGSSTTRSFNIVEPSVMAIVGAGSGNVKSVTGATASLVDEKPEGDNSTVELVAEEKSGKAAERLTQEYAGGEGESIFASVIDVKLVAVTKDDEGNETARREIESPESLTLTFDVAAGDKDLEGKLATVIHMHDGAEAGRSVQPVKDGKVSITVDSLSDFVIVVQDEDFVSDLGSDGVSIAMPDESYVYDGADHEPVPVVTANGQQLVAGTHFSVEYNDNRDAGENTASVTVAGIEPYTGEVTKRFSIAKRKVVLESPSAAKTYDGAPLTSPIASAKGDGFVAGEASNLRAVGSITDAGSAPNAIAYDKGAAFKDGNYEVTENPGTLTVTPAAITQVTASPNSFSYDGKEKRPALAVKAGALDVPESGYIAQWPSDEASAGEKAVTVTGRGNYAGSMTASYTIVEGAESSADGKAAAEAEKAGEEDQAKQAESSKTDEGPSSPNQDAPSGRGTSGQPAQDDDGPASSSGEESAAGGAAEAESESRGGPAAAPSVSMHRLYNPYSYEHFYTADAFERDKIVEAGWTYEGVGWTAPAEGDAVYRLYNPYAGDHHYTLDASERDELVGLGWVDEGTGWYSDPSHTVTLYREYNPFMPCCNHNYTTDKAEHDQLVAIGWVDEGYAWYGV